MNKTLDFKFRNESFQINFPNNRQYTQIQNMKMSLASNYDLLKDVQADAETSYATALVDMEAHIRILCPALVKSLNKPFEELSFEEGRDLVVAYNDQFRPWYNEWLNTIFGANKEEKLDDTN